MYTTGSGKSSSKPLFSGSVLIFGGVLLEIALNSMVSLSLPLWIPQNPGRYSRAVMEMMAK